MLIPKKEIYITYTHISIRPGECHRKGDKELEAKGLGTLEKRNLLDMMMSFHLWTHSGCSCWHKTQLSNSSSFWAGTRKAPPSPSYWQLMAAREGQFPSGVWLLVAHALVDIPTAMCIQEAQAGLWIIEGKKMIWSWGWTWRASKRTWAWKWTNYIVHPYQILKEWVNGFFLFLLSSSIFVKHFEINVWHAIWIQTQNLSRSKNGIYPKPSLRRTL